MAYVRLDDQIDEHPKILRAGPAAAWMWAMAIAYSNRRLTDGFVPMEQIHRLTSVRGPAALKLAEVCVRERLFDAVEGGYRVHDYLDLNPTKEKAETAREAAARRKAEQREREESRPVTRMSQRDRGVTPPLVTDMSQRDMNGQMCDLAGAPATPLPSPPTPVVSDDTTRTAPPARLVSSSISANGTGPEHLACLELVELWNRIRSAPAVAYSELQAPSKRLIRDALRAKGLDAWERIFRRIAASDYLAGRGDFPVVSLFKALELGDKIDAGQFDNRAAPTARVSSLQPLSDFIPARFKTGGVA